MRFDPKLVLAASGGALLALGAVATAQPAPQPQPDEPQPAIAQPQPPVAQPPPQTQPPQQQPPPREREVSIHELAEDAERPHDLSFAIGLGYQRAPGGSFDLQMPNVASARLRLPSGLTFEPTVTLSNTSLDTNDGTMDQTENITEFGIGSLVRFPVIRRGRFDFEILGELDFDITKDDPPGDDNTKTTTTFTLGWGIGIGYWISHHWQLSASATNPLVSYTKDSTDTSATTTTSTSTTSYGIVFTPTIAFMIHLYN